MNLAIFSLLMYNIPMVILVLNCGSSSAKYQVYDWNNKKVLSVGVVERIGLEYSTIEQKSEGKPTYNERFSSPTHKEAIELILKMICSPEYGVIKNLSDIGAVGHRVLHGGEVFKESALVDENTLETLKSLIPLGPLHMPANIMGIEAVMALLPGVPNAIVMDTAFHQTMPSEAFMYALPKEWYEKYNVRRYGFHGTSHLYCSKRASVLLGKKSKDTNVVIAHIGNGASVSAVKNGVCIDTSMGLTPLEGLVMGTRSGDMDPAIMPYIMKNTGVSASEMDTILNKKSGLFGICGLTDRRDVENAMNEGNKDAELAFKMEARRIKKYIGSYMFLLGKVDALVFTAGVGEFGSTMRELATAGLEEFGIKLNKKANRLARSRNGEFEISSKDSKVKVFVIPTDEELVITEDAVALMKGKYKNHMQFKYSFASPSFVNKARQSGLHKDIEKNPDLKKIIAKNSWK